MKNFIEKAKDILYDVSDYIIMFTIILAIGLIIAWRLDILFPQTTAMVVPDKSPEVEKVETPAEVKSTEEEPTTITISIPKGSDSATIGKVLVDNGLVNSAKEFNDKVKELDLEKSLRSGEYDIKKDSSLEDIVKIIANQISQVENIGPPAEEPVEEIPITIKVSIPNGADSTTIGNILIDSGLANSAKEFDDKVKGLDLEKSLRPGDYDIEKNASLEEIVKIIAHKK